MYHIQYIFVNSVYHSYGIVFIAVSIKNIVDMSSNKQFAIYKAYVQHPLNASISLVPSGE